MRDDEEWDDSPLVKCSAPNDNLKDDVLGMVRSSVNLVEGFDAGKLDVGGVNTLKASVDLSSNSSTPSLRA